MSSKALAQTQDKALQLNLATTIYGTFAEIGAGQETANAGLWGDALGSIGGALASFGKTANQDRYSATDRWI